SMSTTTCLTGIDPAASRICSMTCFRSQPDFSSGWVETTILSGFGSSCASASLTVSTGDVSTTSPCAGMPASRRAASVRSSRRAEEERRDRDEEVEVGEARCVVRNAARHPLDAEVVHREEGGVEAHERQPEVEPPELLVVHPTGHLREPVVDAREDREERPAEEHVVDVRDDEVRVRDVDVDRHGGEIDAGEAADHEPRDEAEREQHRRRKVELTRP